MFVPLPGRISTQSVLGLLVMRRPACFVEMMAFSLRLLHSWSLWLVCSSAATAESSTRGKPNILPLPAAPPRLVQLKVEYKTQPLAIDVLRPMFSWEMQHPDRGIVQESFALAVWERGAQSLAKVRQETGNRSIFVPLPDGLSLKSDTTYDWSVHLSGLNINATSSFSTGLLSETDWDRSSAWLAASSVAQMPPGCDGCAVAAQLRKDFILPAVGRLTRARLFVSVPGVGRVRLNGMSVDGVVGTRSRSQYNLRALYSTFDVMHLLREGSSNTLGLSIAGGWYSQYGFGPPVVRCVLRVTVGGNIFELGTDASWIENPGPVQYASIYVGVAYDARLETRGWDLPGYTPAAGEKWTPAVLANKSSSFKLGSARMAAATVPAVEVVHTLTANRMQEPAPGRYVFDFGQGISGFVRLKVRGPRGSVVQLSHGDVLTYPFLGNAKKYSGDSPPTQPMGTIYTEDLDAANQTDVYTLRGTDEIETFEPWATTHGFRYVELQYLTEGGTPPTLDTVEAFSIRSSVEQSGSVSFDEINSNGKSLMNVIQSNVLWGQGDNLQGVPQDCNQRSERQGWTGDAALTADEAALNYDMGSFYHNWLEILDETSPHGAIPCTTPGSVGTANLPANQSCDVSWTTVLPTTAHALMKHEGDLSVDRYWPAITRYTDNLISRASANQQCDLKEQQYNWHCGSPPGPGDPNITCCGIVNLFNEFGDWIGEPGELPWNKSLSNNAASAQILAGYNFVKDLGLVSEMAGWLGKAMDAHKYSAAHAKFQEQFHNMYWNETKGCYGSWTLYGCHERACVCGQASNSVALLAMEGSTLLTPAVRKKVAKFLADDVLLHLNHTTTGIVSWKAQLDALATNGYVDLAYALMSQKSYPSLGYEALNQDEPATTIWEQWGAPFLAGGMDSRNHPMFASIGDAMYTHFSGLQQAVGTFGWEHVVFAPPGDIIAMAKANLTLNDNISQPLRLASVKKRTLRGTFGLSWSLPPEQPKVYTACAVHGYPESGQMIKLGCPNSRFNPIADVWYANWGNALANSSSGTPMENSDDCSTTRRFARNASSRTAGCGYDLAPVLATVCVGKETCEVECGGAALGYSQNCSINGQLINTTAAGKYFGPGGSCIGTGGVLTVQAACPEPIKQSTTLTIEVIVPPNSRASTRIPLLGASPHAVSIAEHGIILWNGTYWPGIVAGVTAVLQPKDDPTVLVIEHGSGRYTFTRTDD